MLTYKNINDSFDFNSTDNNGWTVLHIAAMEKKLLAMEFLLNIPSVNVTAVSASNNTALHYLVRHTFDDAEHLLFVKLLQLMLNKGLNINFQNESMETPLFLACRKGRESIISALLDAGANPNATNRYVRSF